MSLQLNTIEEYQFTHGLHRNYVTGKYIAVQPHDLGRPLTHAEMDYNLILNEQTSAGFRIFGSNTDLTLSDDDVGQSLVFHKISAADHDYPKYTSNGYSVGQYIWILGSPDHFHCEFFTVDSITTTDPGVCSFVILSTTHTNEDACINFVVDSIVSRDEGPTSLTETTEYQYYSLSIVRMNPYGIPGQIWEDEEGSIPDGYRFVISATLPANTTIQANTTVPYTITGIQGSDIHWNGQPVPMTGNITMNAVMSNGQLIARGFLEFRPVDDGIVEGQELITMDFTGVQDSNGVDVEYSNGQPLSVSTPLNDAIQPFSWN
jgi:hypothetical protein